MTNEHQVITQAVSDRLSQVDPKISEIQKFHQVFKLLLMACSPVHYQKLGNLAANPENKAAATLLQEYSELFCEAIRLMPTRERWVNVLQHMFGYFKKSIDSKEKQEVLRLIEEYRQQRSELNVPLMKIRQLADQHHVPYLQEQAVFEYYLDPLSAGNK